MNATPIPCRWPLAAAALTLPLAFLLVACVGDERQLPAVSLCGDGLLERGEACDGTLFPPRQGTCNELAQEEAPHGVPTCTFDCRIDLSTCSADSDAAGRVEPGYCGNGLIEPELGEECDSLVPDTLTCERQLGGDATGRVTCNAACKVDYSACCATAGGCSSGALAPTCTVGEGRCADAYHEQLCYPTSANQTAWGPIDACPIGELCDDRGGCRQADDPCLEGALQCHGDLVEACGRPQPGQPTAWSTVVDCNAVGMTTCREDGGPFVHPTQYCLNACGARATPLAADPCDRDPHLPCAILVCQPDGTLAPDHEACLGHGSPANRKEQCASCYLESGLCVGTQAATCLPPDNVTCHR